MEDASWFGISNPNSRIDMVAATYQDARDTMIEGESGLLGILPRSSIATWNRSLGQLILTLTGLEVPKHIWRTAMNWRLGNILSRILARMRDEAKAAAFRATPIAAMSRVLAEAVSAKKTYPDTLAQTTGSSLEALAVRQ